MKEDGFPSPQRRAALLPPSPGSVHHIKDKINLMLSELGLLI